MKLFSLIVLALSSASALEVKSRYKFNMFAMFAKLKVSCSHMFLTIFVQKGIALAEIPR